MIRQIVVSTALAVASVMSGFSSIPFQAYKAEDVQELARIIWWEARGDTEEGQLAVANVVLNRVKSDKFPDTIREVIRQPGQFTPTENPNYDRVEIPPAFEAIALRALSGESAVCCENVVFFSVGRARYMAEHFKLGAHVFGHYGGCCCP